MWTTIDQFSTKRTVALHLIAKLVQLLTRYFDNLVVHHMNTVLTSSPRQSEKKCPQFIRKKKKIVLMFKNI